MEQPQTLGGEHGLVHCHPRRALVQRYLGPGEGACHHCDVVRRPTEKESDHHRHDHSHGSLPLKPSTDVKEALDGYSIAEQHDGQGDQKTQRVAKNSSGQTPFVGTSGIILFSTFHPTGFMRFEGGIIKPRQRQKSSNSPDGSTHSPAGQLPVRAAGLHGLHDHRVAVHANASQEEDAGVEAQLLDDGDDFAHGASEHPSLRDGSSPEREGEGQQEVSDSQVEEVEVRGGQRLLAQADHQPHHQVSRNGQQEDEDVKHTDDNHGCIWDGVGFAGLRVGVKGELRVVVCEVEFIVNGAEV